MLVAFLLLLSLILICVGFFIYILFQKKQLNKLLSQKSFLFKVIDLNPNYIYAKDQYGRYSLINQSYAQLVGRNIQDIIGKTDEELKAEIVANGKTIHEGVLLKTLPETVFIKEELLTDFVGEKMWVQTVKVPIQVKHHNKVLAVSTNITERKQFEDEIKHQANHDALTGLPNRRMFNTDLANDLETAKIEAGTLAVLLFDIDRFKYINDMLGHDAGDELLVQVSQRLTDLMKHCHPHAKIYRLGGDEFTVLLPNYNGAQSEAFAKDLLELFEESFLIADSENVISPSIGISLYPDDGQDANYLMKHADTAMYYIKANGKRNYQIFTPIMQQHFYRKLMIEKQLRTALTEGEFELYYQPIVDLASNEFFGMESLIRWNNQVLGHVPPDEFIPIAEETGMIVAIGQWILETALGQHVLWQQQFNKKLKINVNVSVRQLLETTFFDMVKMTIERSGVEPTYIALEITESIAMYEESMIEKLYAVKQLGVQLSMDDFGTGYSSLSYLNKYPLDALKIDKSFVKGVIENEENKAIIKTIIAIAKQLELTVVAEGVEEQAVYKFLANIGCDYAQGYYISRPLPATEFNNI